ncbi:uncharacterized protein LOC111096935 isoform X1 [Canis lupus familiaris]|uniref:uncharacterized protein LOC111096935 isoform X1 n=1 Tax=Canis lupus familiaris TaxID=9615 RepID=UPI0018F7DCEA|nr:uncharacterized protein LOC111096935 isoform X1 [Canis lupus familiaris]
MSVKLFELLEDVNKYQSRNLFNRRTRAAGAWGVRGNFRSTRARDPQTLSGRSVGATTSIWRRSSRFSPGESAHGNPASVAADGPSPHADRRPPRAPPQGLTPHGRGCTERAGRGGPRAHAHSGPTRLPRRSSAAPPGGSGARRTSGSVAAHPPSHLRSRGFPPSLSLTIRRTRFQHDNVAWARHLTKPKTRRPQPNGRRRDAESQKRLSAGPPQAPPTDLITLPAHPQPVLQLPRSHLEDSNALLTAGSPASPSELNVSEDCALPPRGAHRVAATGLRSALHPHPFP